MHSLTFLSFSFLGLVIYGIPWRFGRICHFPVRGLNVNESLIFSTRCREFLSEKKRLDGRTVDGWVEAERRRERESKERMGKRDGNGEIVQYIIRWTH